MNESRGDFDYDVVILGGGSAGYAAARTARAAGLKTAVVEGGKEVGGLCILRGCMPTKALLYAAEIRHLTRQGTVWGLHPAEGAFDWAAVMGRKGSQIKDFADYRRQQLEDGRFSFLRASARFTDPHTLELSPGGRLTARHFIIATGSITSTPPIPHLTETGYLTSDEALSLPTPPKSLIVLGGGAVAAEFAQFFARFDVEVTLIQRSERILRDFDADAGRTIETVFRREGIHLHTGTRLLGARREDGGKVVTFEQDGQVKEVAAEEILCALGRSPNTGGLQLERAGVALDGERIITNDEQRTSAPHIFAAGDCTGPHEIVHVAIQQGEIAAHNIAQPERLRHLDERLLLFVVFTDPQVAVVGLTEKAAQAQGVPYRAASYPFNDHGKSLIMEARDGFVKLLADPATGAIIGGTCVGPSGGELIHEVVAAMAGRLTVGQLAAMPHYHPTLAEIWTYPAEELAEQIPANTASAPTPTAASASAPVTLR
jgi:pyruvate/2-oxoglutarate dehydrogenase complex dihydrolipoamide dehydrogenase (E3) component